VAKTFLILFCIPLLLLGPRVALGYGADFCNPTKQRCWEYSGRSTSAPAYPSNNSRITVNPSAVPTDEGFGAEAIVYRGYWDLSIVKGTGRVGAAISPSNGEESFFGPPGFEERSVYLNRKARQEKYTQQKYVLATAMNLYSSKSDGLARFSLSAGVAGRYNKLTKAITPGAGLTGILGPFTFGFAYSQDETQIDPALDKPDVPAHAFRSSSETLSIGLYLNSLAIDYSLMKVYGEGLGNFQVGLLTSSLLLKRAILTASIRQELSNRPKFDRETATLLDESTKTNLFLGVQVTVTKTVMLGVFYNYYLLDEISAGGTLFF
jgi:hypothetical protein